MKMTIEKVKVFDFNNCHNTTDEALLYKKLLKESNIDYDVTISEDNSIMTFTLK